MILLLIQAALFLAVVGLLVGALLVDRSGVHGRDYLVFEERAVLSQRLTVAAFVLVILEFLVGTPLLGAVLATLAIFWTLWWLPADHRRFDVAVQSVFEGDPAQGSPQVAFARVVTDRATFAWLCDVFVLEQHRGKGAGRTLMDAVMSHPDMQGLRNVLLATRDAHGLYAKYGFVPLAEPARWMAIRRPYRG